ncbi:MAG: hypothetical protein ABI723_27160 [Bacteroidia bacterium]
MKHLTILSVSVATILFAGAQFQNRFNNIYTDAKKAQQTISVQVNEVKCKSDSLLISTGSNAAAKAVNKAENSTFHLIGKLVQSLF